MAHPYSQTSSFTFSTFFRQARPLFIFLALPLLLPGISMWNIRGADAPTSSGAEPQSPCLFVSGYDKETGVSQEIIALKQNEPVKRVMKGGEAQLFNVSLNAGQYLRVVVEQRGIALALTLLDTGGKRIVEMDNPSGAYGPVYVSTIAETAGDYRLEVRAVEKSANPGEYEIKIEELRDATSQDRDRILPERAFAEGRNLYGKATKESRLAAIRRYEAALSYWEGVKDQHWMALTFYSLGATHRRLGELETAEKYFNQSLALQPDARDWRLRASVLNDRGLNYADQGDNQKALESLNNALKLYSEHQDRRGQASAFNNIGLIHARAGQMQLAVEFYQKALPLRQAENDRAGELNVLNNMGGVYEIWGEPHKALAHYSKALQIWQEMDNRGELKEDQDKLATGYNNVADAYDMLGEWQTALEQYERSLKIFQKIGNSQGEAVTRNNMGELYDKLGDPLQAMTYYDEARRLLTEKVKNPDLEAKVLSHIGQNYLSQGKLAGALRYFEEALKLNKSLLSQIQSLNNIGEANALQGNLQKAMESYNNSLTLLEKTEAPRSEAITRQKRGEAYLLSGKQTEALADFNRALYLWRLVSDRRGEAATLYSIARIERDRNQLTEALKRSEEAINIIETLRTKVNSQQLRTSYFAIQQNYYELYIDLEMRLYQLDGSLKHLESALQASERSRARSLIDTLIEAQADVTQGVSKELLDHEREVQQRLNAKAQAQMELLNGKHTEEQAAGIAKEIEELIAEYDSLQAKIKVSSPKYAHLTQPQSLKLPEIQKLLDDDTLLLEYALGDEKSYLWLVSSTSVGSASLPKRSDIESAARKFYELLTARQPSPKEPPAEHQKRIAMASAEYPSQAASLSRILLGPVADKLGKKRLVIVGDGMLQYLPFNALPVPVTSSLEKANAQANTTPYLIEEHEIISLPSASAFAVLRNELSSRKRAPLAVVVLADPVFNKDDPRLKNAQEKQVSYRKKAPSSVALASGLPDNETLRSSLNLQPLPSTRYEAKTIEEAATPKQSRLALDFEASRATVLTLQDGRYRIMHFATHGILNTEHPELSGIVLSLVDADGRTQDGILRLHNIYNLKLPVELVVLSACSTGLGNIIKGEGLVGLTRGFMYAGSPRIIASLWRVDDHATALLMGRLYQYMLKELMSPAAALRKAQIEMLKGKQGKYRQAPFYWAGFVLQGEWRENH